MSWALQGEECPRGGKAPGRVPTQAWGNARISRTRDRAVGSFQVFSSSDKLCMCSPRCPQAPKANRLRSSQSLGVEPAEAWAWPEADKDPFVPTLSLGWPLHPLSALTRLPGPLAFSPMGPPGRDP